MPISLSGLYIWRSPAFQVASKSQPVQQVINTLIKSLCSIVPSREVLNKQKENHQIEEMKDHKQKLNHLYYKEMWGNAVIPESTVQMQNEILSKVCATNSKLLNCGYHLSFDYDNGVTMHALKTHQPYIKASDRDNPGYQEMREQQNLLNQLFMVRKREQVVNISQNSGVKELILSQIAAVNIKYSTTGYHLEFDSDDGVTIHTNQPPSLPARNGLSQR